jgi:hypothetical protein
MHESVTVHMEAPADDIWRLVSDVRNTGQFSPETFDAEWLDGASGPAVGVRFRGHVKRNEIGPVYWTVCRVLVGDTPVNNWHYRFEPASSGTDVTESFWVKNYGMPRFVRFLFGELRRRRNIRDMTTTLERIRAVVESG